MTQQRLGFLLALVAVACTADLQAASTNNLATTAAVSTSYVSPWETLLAIRDGHDPTSSTDKAGGAYGNWNTTGTNWVEYQWTGAGFPLGVKVDRVAVYWWTDNGGIMAPAACWVDYWNGSNYVTISNVGVALNQYNTANFAPVITDRVRIRFTSGAASTGILEWKVFGDAVVLEPLLLSGRSVPPGQMEVRWKDSVADFYLETSPVFGSGAQWTSNGLPAPTLIGGSNYVTIPSSDEAAVFRLHARNDFSLQLDPPTLNLPQGTSRSEKVLIGATSTFKQTVSLSVSNLPAGVTVNYNPVSLKSGESALVFVADQSTTPGNYPVTVKGSGPLSSHTADLNLAVITDPPDAPFVWPKYTPDLNYNFTNEFAAIPPPTNILNDCSGVTTTITLPGNWFCFRFGTNKNSLVTSNAWIPMLQRVDTDFRYFRDIMGWPPDKRAKAGYYSAIYLLGSGTCVGGASNDLGGWQSTINYQGQSWPMALLSYYPVYSFDPACPYNDRVNQQGGVVHELIHSVLADMPGCKNACWFQEGGNTWLQGTADSQRTGNYNSMGFLSAGQMIAPFMPIECYSGWLQDDSFGGPCAEGVNMSSNGTQICTWRNLLGGNQYGEAFPHFMGEIVSPGSVAWIWRNCTNRVLDGLANAPGGLGDYQTRRLIKEFRARQVMCDFGKWSGAYKALLNNNWGATIDQEWSPFWIDCAAWTARCYVITTNNGTGMLTPERRTLPGWSGANQVPLTVSNSTGNVTINFTPLGANMSCQLVYRATDNSVIYSKPVSNGVCTLTPPVGKQIKNNTVVAVICNSDYVYQGEFSRTNKFDYRLQITGAGTSGIAGQAGITTKWWQ